MGNKTSSASSTIRTASTHDISDITAESQAERDAEIEKNKQRAQADSVRSTLAEEEKTKSGSPPCPGQGCDGCWVCDWD
jgi:hypothetical protein